jgi:hypothetical protein
MREIVETEYHYRYAVLWQHLLLSSIINLPLLSARHAGCAHSPVEERHCL